MIAVIVVDLTVTTPANRMAHAARARQRGHRLLQCIKTRLARSDISLERMHSVAVGGIGDIACDLTSPIEPRRPGTQKAILPSQRPDLLKRLFDDPLIERGVERERRRANDQKKIA